MTPNKILRALFPVILLAWTMACEKPTTVAPSLAGRPLLVRLECAGCEPGGPLDVRYGEALRDRLANQARILPAGDPEADQAATLVVRLRIMDGRSEVVREAAGKGFDAGFKEGWKATGKSGDGLHDALFDAAAGVVVGTVFGLVAAPVNAATAEARALYHNARLGYKPRHVVVQVGLLDRPDSKEVALFETTAFEVVKGMRPMSNAEAREPGRLAKEEAFVLAQLISQRLEREFGWKQGAVD